MSFNMKSNSYILLLLGLLLWMPDLKAQLQVSHILSPQQMVDILVGTGITYSNVQYTGFNEASGKFWGETNIGMDEGIILTSGKAINAIGPNSSGSTGFDNNGPSDPDLQQMANYSIQDACILEFDFVPQDNQMRFKYVFASDEYPEWVGSSYNDAFGFFISGPGISGDFSNNSDNIARIPLTNPPVYVTINNVNGGSYPQYYVNNEGGQTIEYDGFTTVLTAVADVIPCETYHIKLAIGDAGDGDYDSGVFLKANSFSSGGIGGMVAFPSPYIDTMAVEDCNTAQLVFEIDRFALEDLIIPLDIGGTAINGVDYDTIPDTVMIPKGDTAVFIDIIPWEDGLIEGLETVEISYNQSICEPDSATLTINIYDHDDYIMEARPDTTIGCAEPVELYTTFTGGVPPYFYDWYVAGEPDPFDTIPNPIVNPYNPTEYIVHQVDACGDTLVDTVMVDVIGPTATVSGDTSICLGDFATLIAGGGTSYLWEPTGDTTATIQVSPTDETMYIITVYDDCNNFDQDTVTVFVNNPQADAGEDVNICIGESVTLTAGGGLSYEWSNGEQGQSITVSPTDTTCYVAYVTDACGNTATDTVCVFVNAEVIANAGPDQEICVGDTAVLTAGGGIEYEWSTGEDSQSIEVFPTETTTYYVTVTEGCSDEDSVTVIVNPLPDVLAEAQNQIICFGDSVMLMASGADTYLWSADPPDPGLGGQDTLSNPVVSPTVNTVYTLRGTLNSTGCINTNTVSIAVKEPLTALFDLSALSVCSGDEVVISYGGNATASATYSWDFDGGTYTGTGQGPYNVSWEEPGEKSILLFVNEGGCESDTSLQNLMVNPTPEVDFAAASREGCPPFTVSFYDSSLSVIPNANYVWHFGTGDSSNAQNPVYTYQEAGEYTVALRVENDVCADSKSTESFIIVNENPEAGFNVSPTLTSIKNPEVSVSDESSSDAELWTWDMGDGSLLEDDKSFTHTYQDTGLFVITLVVQNAFGCMDTTFKYVEIKPHPSIYAPNAFRPGSNVGNDKFNVKSIGIEKFNMKIYSRWGELLYETNNLSQGWDGTLNGSPAPAGTYVYQINYTNNLGQTEEVTGTVVLVR